MFDEKIAHILSDGVDIAIARTVPYTGKAIISRFKSSYSDYTVQNRRRINLLVESALTTGELLTYTDEGNAYLITAIKPELVENGLKASIIAHGLLCNTTLTVTRDVLTDDNYDEYGNLISGPTPTTIINAIPCRADQVTSRMRQEDPGLLSTTVLKVYAKNDNGLVLLDKASVAGGDYRVDDINRLEIPGAMVLQLSVWVG